MRPLFSTFQIAVLGGLAALFCGCEANLTTKVEVYQPQVRLTELAEERDQRHDSEPTQFEQTLKLLSDKERNEAIAEADPQQWFEQRLNKVEAANTLAKNVTLVLNKVWPQKIPADPIKAIVLDVQGVVLKTSQALQDVWGKYGAGQESFERAKLDCQVILYDFAAQLENALNVVDSGNAKFLQPLLRANVVVPAELQDVFGSNVSYEQLTSSSGSAGLNLAQNDRSGVYRPDSIIETYTHPLLKLALRDYQGWENLPAATTTSADGKSSMVIVRDGEFSFSVHSFDNDPSDVIASRLKLGISTANILAQGAAMFIGAPGVPGMTQVPGMSTSLSSTSTNIENTVLSARVLTVLARDRERNVDSLLAKKPQPKDPKNLTDDDKKSIKAWLDQVNALFQK